MTDNDIIKALEYCSKRGGCIDCPIHVECCADNYLVERKALAIINRQKAEIACLKNKQQATEQATEQVRAEAIKEFAERAKIEYFTEFFCGQKFDLIHGWIDDLVKEMVGEGE